LTEFVLLGERRKLGAWRLHRVVVRFVVVEFFFFSVWVYFYLLNTDVGVLSLAVAVVKFEIGEWRDSVADIP
jgi:hypothetical protein